MKSSLPRKMPKISIITPVYNSQQFIKSCIEVVVDQAFIDIEHIFVDGDSTDKTVEIIKLYAEKYPHIRWISEPDRGQSDAMNKGIAMAKAEIIGILNVDDYYEPNVLNRVWKIFQDLPELSFLVGNCNIRDKDNQLITVSKPKKMNLKDLLLGPYINPKPVNPSAYFYHKSLHDRVGLYNVDEHYGMDTEFILKVVQVANVKYVDETWGNFCKHENSKTVLDEESNSAIARRERIYDECVKNLPFRAKLPMYFFRLIGKFYHLVLPKIHYFYRYPHHLLPSIKKKLAKI